MNPHPSHPPLRRCRTGLGAAVLLATPAFARMVPDPADAYPGHVTPASVPASVQAQVQVRTIVAGGMPGWQIALIAVGAALLAAALAVLADRALAARRRAITTAAYANLVVQLRTARGTDGNNTVSVQRRRTGARRDVAGPRR